MKKLICFATMGLLALILAGCVLDNQASNIQGQNLTKNLQTQSVKLADVPQDYSNTLKITAQPLSLAFGSYGNKVAYIVKKSSKSSVFVNGKEGRWCDNISTNLISELSLTITTDSNDLIYVCNKDSEDIVMKNDQEIGRYNHIQDLKINKDGYFSMIISDKESRKFVVFNGKEGAKYNNILFLTANPNGGEVAYYGCGKEKKDAGCYFVTQDSNGYVKETIAWTDLSGNVFYDGFDFISHGKINYSLDGKLLSHVERIFTDNDQLVVNGEKINSQDDYVSKTNIQEVVFTPNNQNLAYSVQVCKKEMECNPYKNEGKMYVVYNSSKGSEYDEIRDLTFSPSASMIYWGRKAADWYLIQDDKEYYQFSSPLRPGGEFAFAANGDWVYTVLDVNKKTYIVDLKGNKGKTYDLIMGLRYTPSNKLIFVTATGANNNNAKMKFVVDGKEHQSYDQVWGFFDMNNSYSSPIYKYTPDGKNVVYGSQQWSELWWVVDPID